MKVPKHIDISNTTIKKAKELFKGHTVNSSIDLLNSLDLPTIISEFIDDSDNQSLKQCLCFIIGRSLNDLEFPYGIYK